MVAKTTMKYTFTHVLMALIKKKLNYKCQWGYQEKKLSINLYNHCRKQYEGSSKK